MSRRFLILCLLLCSTTIHAMETTVRKVGISVDINDISHIYPKQEAIDLSITLHLRWQIKALSDKARYFKGDAVNDVLRQHWFPYYHILHSRDKIEVRRQSLVIQPNGQVDYLAHLATKVGTAMNMSAFPFDKHTLKIMFKPFGASRYQQQYYLLSQKVGMESNVHLQEWRVDNPQNAILNDGESIYEVTFDYERKSAFYIYKIMFPLFIILVMSYAVLWLPNQPAINRLGVVLTAILTIVAFQWAVTNDVPPVPYVTLFQALLFLGYFLICSLALVIVMGEAWSGQYKMKITRWSRRLFFVMFFAGLSVIWFLWG